MSDSDTCILCCWMFHPTNLAIPCRESLQPHDSQASPTVQSGEIVNDTVAMYTVVDDVLVLLVRYDHLTWVPLLTFRSHGLERCLGHHDSMLGCIE